MKMLNNGLCHLDDFGFKKTRSIFSNGDPTISNNIHGYRLLFNMLIVFVNYLYLTMMFMVMLICRHYQSITENNSSLSLKVFYSARPFVLFTQLLCLSLNEWDYIAHTSLLVEYYNVIR